MARGRAVARMARANEHEHAQREQRVAEQVETSAMDGNGTPFGSRIVERVPDQVGDQERCLGRGEDQPWTAVARSKRRMPRSTATSASADMAT